MRALLIMLLFGVVLAQSELLSNTDFETTEGWSIYFLEGASGDGDVQDGAFCLDVADGGAADWHTQLLYEGVPFAQGHRYVFSFEAKSSVPVTIGTVAGMAHAPWQNFAYQQVSLGESFAPFSLSFVMEMTNENSRVGFFAGGFGEQDKPVTLCFRKVSLLDDGSVAQADLASAVYSDNLLPTATLTVLNDATASLQEGDELCIDAAGDTPDIWSVQLTYPDLSLMAETRYRLSFRASATADKILRVKIGESSMPFVGQWEEDVMLSSDPLEFSANFMSEVSDDTAKLTFFLGNLRGQESGPVTICLSGVMLVSELSAEARPYIMVDQFGYLPDMPKVAVLADPQIGFNANDSYEPGSELEVIDLESGEVVLHGAPVPWNDGEVQASSGDRGWWFDFSALTIPGRYLIRDVETGMQSYPFTIAEDVYSAVMAAALRMFYYNRANIAKIEPYADPRWTDGESFVGPGQDTEARFVDAKDDPTTARDLSGGWFDAGDYNKYATFAEGAVHVLLAAYRENPQAFTDDLNIPESGNGIPDILDEIMWELEWLKRMQDEDGGVIIKMGNIDFNASSPPSSDTRPRYYGPVCSSATIAVAGMFAHSALVLAEFDELTDVVSELEERAVSAWDWYMNNERRDDCDTQEIKSGDADRSLAEQDAATAVAAVYLYALTGDERYHEALKTYYPTTRPFGDSDPRWSMYNPEHGDALLFYSTLETADPELAERIQTAKVEQAYGPATDIFRFAPERDPYRAFMRNDGYHWGSNWARANLANTNMDMLHFELDVDAHDSYLERAAGILHYFHGKNPLNLVYLSNMYEYGASRSVNEIWHDWFTDGSIWDNALTSERGPAPGYFVGGPNANYTGESSPPSNQPRQKAYRDWNSGAGRAWEITEPAIYYQASYIRLLANFVRHRE